MGGKSKPAKQTTNTVQNVERVTTPTPWQPADLGLKEMISQAAQAYAATPKTPVFTGPNATQQSAVNYLTGQAAGTATGGQELRDLGQATARGDFLNPSSNPYIMGAISAAVDPYREQLDQNILKVGDVSSMNGAYGGDRSALLRASALTGFNKAATNVSASMLADNYGRERQLQQNAGNILAQGNELMLKPGQVLAAAGDQQQSWDMARIAALQEAPWTGLDRYASILGQVQPYASTTSTGTETTNSTGTQTPARGSTATGVATGALGGAASGFQVGGPWGAAIGGIVGGLGGLFG